MAKHLWKKRAARESARRMVRECITVLADQLGVTICEKCQKPLHVGDFPFCPHEATSATTVIGDELDYVDHNLGAEPVHITSREQRKRLMAERGLVEAVRHVPVPGSDRSPHTTNWAAGCVDLEAAAALVSRMGAPVREKTPETADRSGVAISWHQAGDVPAWSIPE